MIEIIWLMIKQGMKKKIQGPITKKDYVKIRVMFVLYLN